MEDTDYIHMHIYDTNSKLNLQDRTENGMVKFTIVNKFY